MRSIYILTILVILPLAAFSQGIYERHGLTYDSQGELLRGRYVHNVEDEDITKVMNYYNGLLHGEFLVFDDKGNLLEKGRYFDGQKDGKWSSWTTGGVKTGEAEFDHGQRDGKWQIWDEQGVLRYVMFYDVDPL